jgi:hydroxyethylthiazole kinase
MLFGSNNSSLQEEVMSSWFGSGFTILDQVREKHPLVHHITNYVTVNDCANITLAIGAAPVMADDLREVAEIVGLASALVLNIGTLNQRTIAAMLAAGKTARTKGIPVVLDPVGAGATRLRTETALQIIREVQPTVIRGNLSEIKAISGSGGSTRGVDASEADIAGCGSSESIRALAASFARETGSVIAITGAVDIITDGKRSCFIQNGHSMMARVTGTGCMCSSLIGSFCGADSNYLSATAAAITAMGVAGELAYKRIEEAGLGSGSYRSFIIDEISLLSDKTLTERGKLRFD